jgi:hypothetical protein
VSTCKTVVTNSFEKVNTDTVPQNLSAVDVIITRCPDKSYCCGYNATKCCDNKAGYWINNGKVTGHNHGPPQPFLLANAGQSSDGNDSASGRSQSTLKIALGVGLGVGLVFIALLTANLWIMLRRKRRTVDEIQLTGVSGSPGSIPQEIHPKGAEMHVVQVEMEQPKVELYQPPQELEEPLIEMDSTPAKPRPDAFTMDKKS